MSKIVDSAAPGYICMLNWFSPRKSNKHHKSKNRKDAASLACQIRTPLMEQELPGNFYVGGVELFAGALICILPFPGCIALGVATMGDGLRRVCDGVIQYNDERRADPNYAQPPSPFNLNF